MFLSSNARNMSLHSYSCTIYTQGRNCTEKKIPPGVVIQQKRITDSIIGVLGHEYSHIGNDLKSNWRYC